MSWFLINWITVEILSLFFLTYCFIFVYGLCKVKGFRYRKILTQNPDYLFKHALMCELPAYIQTMFSMHTDRRDMYTYRHYHTCLQVLGTFKYCVHTHTHAWPSMEQKTNLRYPLPCCSLTYFRTTNASTLWKVLSYEWWYTFPMSNSTAYTSENSSLYEGLCKRGMLFLKDLAIEIRKIVFYYH
jgi:hypothetical protein